MPAASSTPAAESAPTEKREAFMVSRFGAHQWQEGKLRPTLDVPPQSWTIIRSHDAKNLYYRVAHRLLDESPQSIELEWIQAGNEELPIRRARFRRTPSSPLAIIAAYLLVYDGEPVANPYLNQLVAAPLRVFTGSRPMTVFLIAANVQEKQTQRTDQVQAEWLVDAWKRYRRICRP